MHSRYLTSPIHEDLLDRKMVAVSGPRQVGKTTLAARLVSERFEHPVCLNWDNRGDRKAIMAGAWPGEADLVVLDEFHKYRRWKSLLKGEYDKLKEDVCFVVTGSARLDVFRRGGDSLQGRYHHYRLHPFTLGELDGAETSQSIGDELVFSKGSAARRQSLDDLEHFGGFPEPLFKQNERFLRRWHNERVERVFREDIRDMTMVRDLGAMKVLCDMLPERVGSLFSTNAVREEIQVSHRATSHWLDILESFYYQFRIYPFAATRAKSLRRNPKLYLWDWSEIADPAARFENLVASHLLKFVHILQDRDGYRSELCFLRDPDGREVDFLVTIDRKPWFAVEVKLSDTSPSRALSSLADKWHVPYRYQVVRQNGVDVRGPGCRVMSAERLLGGMG